MAARVEQLASRSTLARASAKPSERRHDGRTDDPIKRFQRALELIVPDACSPGADGNDHHDPPPDVMATDLVAQASKEEQQGELDRPQTTIE